MILYLIFLVVGGLLLAAAIVALKNRLAFVKSGERAVGTVVQLIETKDEEGISYLPVFDIPTRQHKTITYKHPQTSSQDKWQPGKTATFIFEPGKPDSVQTLNYWGIFWWPISLLVVAVDLLIIGSGYFLLRGYFDS